MSELDDPVISGALSDRTAVGDVGVEAALDAVNRRATSTRRRRAAVAGVGAMGGVILLATAALATRSADVVRTPTDSGVPVATDGVAPTDVVATTAPSATTTDAPVRPPAVDPTAPTSVSGTSPASVAPPTTAAAPAGTAPVSTVPSSTPTATTAPGGTASSSTAAPPSAPDTSAAPATSEPDDDEQGTPPFTNRVYRSDGGSITVSWNGNALSLTGTAPAAGYDAVVEDQRADRIRVRFDGPGGWRIEVRAGDDGVVTSSVSS